MTKTFYIVRNKEGKFLRSKGYGGSGECWVDDLEKAKVWSRPGPAKAQVTWWLTHYPSYGLPEIVPLVATMGKPLPFAKASFRKMRKDLDALLKEKEEVLMVLSRLREDEQRAQSPSVKRHIQDSIYNMTRRKEGLEENEKKQRQVLRVLEVACTSI